MKFVDLWTSTLYATKRGQALIVLDSATMYTVRRVGRNGDRVFTFTPTKTRQASAGYGESTGVLVLRGMPRIDALSAFKHPRLPELLPALTAGGNIDTEAILADLFGARLGENLYVATIAPRDIASDYDTREREREAEIVKRRAAKVAEREREAARAQRRDAVMERMRGLVSGVPDDDEVVTIRLGALEQLVALARKE